MSGRPLVARPTIHAEDPQVSEWFPQPTDQEFQPHETRQVTLQITIPPGVTAGTYGTTIVLSNIENPDEEFSEGPRLSLNIGVPAEPEKKGGFPWWILAVVGGLLLLVGIGVGVFFLMQGGSKVASVQLEAAGEAHGETMLRATALDGEGEVLEEPVDFNGEGWAWTVAPEGIATVTPELDGARVACSLEKKGEATVTLASADDEALSAQAAVTCAPRLAHIELEIGDGGRIPALGTAIVRADELDQENQPIEASWPLDDIEQWAWGVDPADIAEVQPTERGATVTCLEGKEGDVNVTLSSVTLDPAVTASLQASCQPAPPKPPAPKGAIEILPSPAKGRAPLQVAFVSKDPTAKSWSWEFGQQRPIRRRPTFSAIATAQGQTATYRFLKPGRYSVKLTVVGVDGQKVTKTFDNIVTVEAAPAPNASFKALPTSGKSPLRVQFAASSPGQAAYAWDFGDGTKSSSSAPTKKYTAPTNQTKTYTAKLTVKNADGKSATSSTTIRVQGPPPGPVPCPEDMECNVDRPGFDYKNFAQSKPDPAGCRAACVADGKCQSFTYLQPGVQGTQARCYLKNAFAPRKGMRGAISGAVRSTPMSNIDLPGNDAGSVTFSGINVAKCRAMCIGRADCVAYTFYKNRCYFKRSLATPRGLGGAISQVIRDDRFDYNIDYLGSDFRSYRVATADPRTCRQMCRKDSGCKTFTFLQKGVRDSNAYCFLKNAYPKPREMTGAISGRR